jgi:hypothetical protein
LNSERAPRWVELVDPDPQSGGVRSRQRQRRLRYPLPGSGGGEQPERFAAEWLVDAVIEAADAEPGVIIASLSAAHGAMSATYHDASEPGRQHQAGMEVDVYLPESARTPSGGVGLNAAEQAIVDYLVALDDAIGDPSRGMQLAAIVTPNQQDQ